MKIMVLADIHGNLPALQAVLRQSETDRPDMIISVGDQINLGPCGQEVMKLLREYHVLCLRGNHERYILEALAGEAKYNAANFGSIRFFAERFTAQELMLPLTRQLGDVLFCHAMPEDDRFPVPYPEQALPLLKDGEQLPARHIICGHGHDPRHYVTGSGTVDVIGSLGCMDHGMPGWACYGELILENNVFCLTNRFVAYDTTLLRPLFLRTGYARACPVMARMICKQMEQNHGYMVGFVEKAIALSRQRNESEISAQTWLDTDAAMQWPDGLTAEAFWQLESTRLHIPLA